jgi:hypothetical protein
MRVAMGTRQRRTRSGEVVGIGGKREGTAPVEAVGRHYCAARDMRGPRFGAISGAKSRPGGRLHCPSELAFIRR